jgi:hypothetical protein
MPRNLNEKLQVHEFGFRLQIVYMHATLSGYEQIWLYSVICRELLGLKYGMVLKESFQVGTGKCGKWGKGGGGRRSCDLKERKIDKVWPPT